MYDDDEDALRPRPFADVLRELAGGDLYDELTNGMAAAVAKVMRHRKPAKLTLTLTISPAGETSVDIADTLKIDVPKTPRPHTIFFAVDGALTRDNPARRDERVRSVEPPSRATRTVSAKTETVRDVA